MRFITAAMAAATLAASAAAAVAAPAPISDVAYLTANQCLGIMTSHALGSPDAVAMRQFIRNQTTGRQSYIYDKADEMRDDARRDADRGGTDERTRLTSERDGLCHQFLASMTTTSSGSRGTPSTVR
jgi:hypothetical protein